MGLLLVAGIVLGSIGGSLLAESGVITNQDTHSADPGGGIKP